MQANSKEDGVTMKDGKTILEIEADCALSRKSGIKLRKAVECFTPCIVDFSKVFSMSHGFADEFFGVLVARYGPKWFKANVTIQNMNEDIRTEALRAVDLRCNGVC